MSLGGAIKDMVKKSRQVRVGKIPNRKSIHLIYIYIYK